MLKDQNGDQYWIPSNEVEEAANDGLHPCRGGTMSKWDKYKISNTQEPTINKYAKYKISPQLQEGDEWLP